MIAPVLNLQWLLNKTIRIIVYYKVYMIEEFLYRCSCLSCGFY